MAPTAAHTSITKFIASTIFPDPRKIAGESFLVLFLDACPATLAECCSFVSRIVSEKLVALTLDSIAK